MTQTRCIATLILLFLTSGLFAADTRPRVIATTDGEIDDRCSMVRFLLYANEWDIAGIIYSSSKFHWVGRRWEEVGWIDRDIDLYGESYENLKRHAPGFPTPDELKRVVYVGNIDYVGEMEKDTPGAERIADVLLDSDPRLVYLQAWGGTNTIARALKKIQTYYPDQMARVSKKAVVYVILDQDLTLREYIMPNWPDVQVLGSYNQFDMIAYRWKERIPESLHSVFLGPWMIKNILEGHGPLCSRYEAHDDFSFRSEGDSPAFMHQIDVGLRSLEHPTYGGWNGRFARQEGTVNVWEDARDDGDYGKPIWRFAEAFQNDWAARADWAVKPPGAANHPPVVKLANPLDLTIAREETVVLDASPSSDPDGDNLTYRWWQYVDAGTFPRKVELKNANTAKASFVMPRWNVRGGQTVHLICEVTDDGTPPLTRYQRTIVTIRDPDAPRAQ